MPSSNHAGERVQSLPDSSRLQARKPAIQEAGIPAAQILEKRILPLHLERCRSPVWLLRPSLTGLGRELRGGGGAGPVAELPAGSCATVPLVFPQPCPGAPQCVGRSPEKSWQHPVPSAFQWPTPGDRI